MNFSSPKALLCLCVAMWIIAGCNGGSKPGASPENSTQSERNVSGESRSYTIAGTATLGAIADGAVFVYEINSDRQERLLSTCTTNSVGRYSCLLSQPPSHVVKVVVAGGTYKHEITGETESNRTLAAIVLTDPAVPATEAHISAMTHITAAAFERLPQTVDSAVAVINYVSGVAGYPIVSTPPWNSAALAVNYAVAQLAANSGIPVSSRVEVLSDEVASPYPSLLATWLTQAFAQIVIGPVGATLLVGPDPAAALLPAPPPAAAPPPHNPVKGCFECHKDGDTWGHYFVWAPLPEPGWDGTLLNDQVQYKLCGKRAITDETKCKTAENDFPVCCQRMVRNRDGVTFSPENSQKKQLECKNSGGKAVDEESEGCRKAKSCYHCTDTHGYSEHVFAFGTLAPMSGARYDVYLEGDPPTSYKKCDLVAAGLTDASTWPADEAACKKRDSTRNLCCGIRNGDGFVFEPDKRPRTDCPPAPIGVVLPWDDCLPKCFQCESMGGYTTYAMGVGSVNGAAPTSPPTFINFQPPVPGASNCKPTGITHSYQCAESNQAATACCEYRDLYNRTVTQEVTRTFCANWKGVNVDKSLCVAARDAAAAAR